ncbi:MAG: hypothetical protein MRY64_16310 [Hyphomonadaceae bacterium]|nr:hypothetical protein [Hyphomonadaceae bacterium]
MVLRGRVEGNPYNMGLFLILTVTQVHDENENFLFADQTVPVEDTDGTAGDFVDSFIVWQGS